MLIESVGSIRLTDRLDLSAVASHDCSEVVSLAFCRAIYPTTACRHLSRLIVFGLTDYDDAIGRA